MSIRPGNLATVAVGLLFIVAGVYGYLHIGRFLDSARETSAVVIEMVNESATRKGRTHPVVRFTTEHGESIVVRSDEHHNVKTGDTLQLLYDSRNPQSIEITTRERASKRRLVFTGLSIVVGLFVCYSGLRQSVR